MRLVARGWPPTIGSIRSRRSLVFVGNLADSILKTNRGSAGRVASEVYLGWLGYVLAFL